MMEKQTKIDFSRNSFQFWSGFCFFILVCTGIIIGSLKLYRALFDEPGKAVSNLVIDGQNPFTQETEILDAIQQAPLQNFFTLNVNQVQQHLEALPWVYSASVRKQWPDTIQVYVMDQVPVAQWNDDFFINQFGGIFQADKHRLERLSQPLPKLFGPEGSESLALENYRNLNSLLTYVDVSISEMVLTERHAWQITLNNGVFLKLGRENRVERVQRFMDVYGQIKQLAQDKMQVDYIDLRYDTGMAVGWKAKSSNQEQEQKTNA
ncbi:cell division protein FtsQ/DivIB [Thalassotalea aquiviva]|uniref:cell division protein FtsQ/DivIB n=1 Tax=Thalassotalea aquiviva TaxID=3242415 RepID=UPI003529FFB7